MCARYTLTAEDKEILKAHPLKGLEGYRPDPNIAITDKGLIITSDEPDRIQHMHFGIVPYNATSNKLSFDTWNIRSEEVMEKKTYKPLMINRKTCLIISDGFIEWKEEADGKDPYHFTLLGRKEKTFCFAGLWSQWMDPETNEPYRTYGIMTTVSNETVGRVHTKKRMPVILPRNQELKWLDKNKSIDELLAMCVPYPDSLMIATKLKRDINAVSTKKKPNKGIDLLKPLNTDEEPKQGDLGL
ncbi:MAG: SOS response-associated peptidase [Flavobacterium sp.]|nr:MAG: SOS response-associated peptidase [Flavobacterium sp.]